MVDGKISINILYEDNHLLVVEKPVNVLSQGDNTGDEDLLSILKEDIKERYNKPGNVYLGLVHRIDRPVGGAMVFAKTSKAASRLSDQIRKNEFKKTYMAVIYGIPGKAQDYLVNYLFKDERTNIVRVVEEGYSGSKKAVLDYSIIGSKEEYSLVKINLHTGRSHQIRVQFSNIGHPLYGDQKYGVGKSVEGQQIALWSFGIELEHPTRKERMKFISEPPRNYPWNLFNIIE